MTSPHTTATEPTRRASSARRTLLLRWLLPPLFILLLLPLIHWPHAEFFQHAGRESYSTVVLSLLAATLALTGLFQLAARTANERVAWASVLVTALYPVFYEASASADARADIWATAFVMWLLFFSLPVGRGLWRTLLLLALSLVPVLLRLVYASWRTGETGEAATAFGGTGGASEWWRVLEACGVRAWQAFGHEGLYLLTTVMLLLTVFVKPVSDGGVERGRIEVRVQLCFAAVALVYIILLSFTSHAERAREMLPVVPLVVLVSVSTVWRRVKYWFVVIAALCAAFAFV